MVFSVDMAQRIVTAALGYVNRPYDFDEFNCVHFVRSVCADVGITLPKLVRGLSPPSDFHLTATEFDQMPLGHSVFFKRKESSLPRIWTHIAIIVSSTELVHCSRRVGKVVVTPKAEFLTIYRLI